MQSGKQLILKRAKDFDKNLEEDLIFAKRTEEAWKKYEKGEFIEMDFDDFQKIFSKIKNKDVKEKILKQISRIKERPEVGKPMKYARIGTREVYMAPFRLSYNYSKDEQ